jgi:hypothetical protein
LPLAPGLTKFQKDSIAMSGVYPGIYFFYGHESRLHEGSYSFRDTFEAVELTYLLIDSSHLVISAPSKWFYVGDEDTVSLLPSDSASIAGVDKYFQGFCRNHMQYRAFYFATQDSFYLSARLHSPRFYYYEFFHQGVKK